MTVRVATYCRFSSEKQRDASLDDQLEVCRRYIDRQADWSLTHAYADRALSGANTRMRPGFLQMLADAEAGRFDVLVTEAVDRLGRNLADVAALFDRLSFRGVEVHATGIGLVTQMHIGIMGTMAQLTLTDLRDKTRRGQLGRARAGRIPGGLAFGYEVVVPAAGSRDAGERRIKSNEAEIIRRIFRDFAAGKSPRTIARVLNAAGISGPGGRPWGDTTIRGQVDRGTGIINNSIYIGQLSWNRCSYVKDPRTGRRVARVNPLGQREVVEIPELRIVDQPLWDAARRRQAETSFVMGKDGGGNALNRAHRQTFLLSGLLTCGCCGGGYAVIGKDRYGCATRRGKGTCSNGRTITRQSIEARVLGALKERLLTPDLVEDFVQSFAEEMATLQRTAGARHGQLQQELADVERRLAGVLRAVENGAWHETLRTRLTVLETRKIELVADLAAVAAPPVVRLHPNAAAIYRDKVAALEVALNDADVRTEAAEILRSMISAVVLTPDDDAVDKLAAELHGDLAMILRLATEAAPGARGSRSVATNEKLPGTYVPRSLLSVVAGTGYHLDLLLAG